MCNKYLLLFLIAVLSTTTTAFTQTVNIYASPNGINTGNGSTPATAVSLSQARTIAKANLNNPVIIWLQDGIYTTNITLDATDSRTAAAPLTYRAVNPKKAIFNFVSTINRSAFQPIPDSIKQRIVDTNARNYVRQLDLTSYNLSNMNVWPLKFEIGTVNWPKFYKDSIPLPMSQYPNDTATMKMRTVLDNGVNNVAPGGSFKYRDARCIYWSKAVRDGLWLKGNWRVAWQITYVKTLSINTTDSTIVQSIGIANGIGDKYTRPGGNGREPYVAVNLVEEIDFEGEWAIDFTKKILYMWLPATGQINVASNDQLYAISLTNVNNVNFENITVNGGAGGAVNMTNCSNITVAGFDVKYCSNDAIRVTGGNNCTIKSNNLYELGEGGIIIAPASQSAFNADQLTLTPNNHKVLNNHIYEFAKEVAIYKPAIHLATVIGTYVAHNKIHGTPHVGILYDGNNNILEFNEQYDIIRRHDDMGAFYRATGPKSRGNKMRYNYVHDSPLSKGSFYDNGSQGDSTSYQIDANNKFGTQNNGGYFNTYTNSIIVRANPAVSSSVISTTDPSFQPVFDSLKSIYNASAVYRNTYPETADMVGSATINTAYTSRIWPRFTCNVLIANTAAMNGVSDNSLFNSNGTTNASFAQTSTPFTSNKTVFANNFKMNGVLTNPITTGMIDSLKKISAFSRTCNTNWRINRIGLYNDEFRNDAEEEAIKGIAHKVTVRATTTNNFVFPANITLSVKIENPNIANCFSAIKLYDNGTEMSGLNLVLSKSAFDSVTYTANWNNAATGTHNITAVVIDSPYWRYNSNVESFNVSSVLATNIQLQSLNLECRNYLQWNTSSTDINYFTVESSINGNEFVKQADINPCNNPQNNCTYKWLILFSEHKLYRLRITNKDGSHSYSNTVKMQPCNAETSMQIVPNPVVSNTCFINISNHDYTEHVTIEIISSEGKRMLQQKALLTKGSNSIALNTSALRNGVYLIKISDSKVHFRAVQIIISR